MNYGIIDIGSNTVRIVVYKVQDGNFEYIFNEKKFIQLINFIENGVMKDAGIGALICALQHMQSMALRFDLNELRCFATAPFRALKEPEEMVNTLKKFTGLDVEILSGEEEARLGVTGARYREKIGDGLFVDLGGGSVEITLLKSGKIENTRSLDMGCVTLSKHVSEILPSQGEIKELKSYIDAQLLKLKWLKKAEGLNLYCIGGTARALCRIHQTMEGRFQDIEGYSIPAKEIKNVCKFVVDMNTDGIRLLTKICPGRIFTFIPGSVVLWRLAKISSVKKAYFGEYGVREGYLIEHVLTFRETNGGCESDTENKTQDEEQKLLLCTSNI